MRLVFLGVILASVALAWQSGPYKILKTAKTGGLGGFDYIYADADGRRLYIPRGAVANATPPIAARITVFDLDTLAPAGEIPIFAPTAPRSTRSPGMGSRAASRWRCGIPRH